MACVALRRQSIFSDRFAHWRRLFEECSLLHFYHNRFFSAEAETLALFLHFPPQMEA